MARPVLPTDFKDDILAESMSGKRRYRIIQNTDGTVSLDDVTDYEQVGSTFGAKQVNDMSSAVNSIEDVKAANNCTTTEPGFVLDARQGKTLMDKSNELSRDLKFPDGTGFYPDIKDGVRGYNTDPKRGADTFNPFHKELTMQFSITPKINYYSTGNHAFINPGYNRLKINLCDANYWYCYDIPDLRTDNWQNLPNGTQIGNRNDSVFDITNVKYVCLHVDKSQNLNNGYGTCNYTLYNE